MRRQLGAGRVTEQTVGEDRHSQVGLRKRLAEKPRYLQTIVVGEPSRSANVLEIGKAHSQVDPRAREGQGANIPRKDYQSFSTRICAGQQDGAGGQSVCDGW